MAEVPPIVHERAKLVASNPSRGDFANGGIAVDGNTLVVGSSYAEEGGRAYVFKRRDGVWAERMVLAGSDVESGDRFGEAVAMAGNLIFVGATEPISGHLGEETRGRGGDGFDAGEVYVFEHGVEVAKIEAEDAQSSDLFGWSLALSGEQLLVGSKHSIQGGTETGAVYVFEQGEGGVTDWRQVQKITLPIAPHEQFEDFGFFIAANEDYLLISSTGRNVPGAVDDVVWAYERSPLGDWSFETLLSSSENKPDAEFGRHMAIEGETAFIGAPGWFREPGAVFVFERDPVVGWQEVAKLSVADERVSDFGDGIAIEGDTLVVSAATSGPLHGAAFVYRKDADGSGDWNGVATLLSSRGRPFDWLGSDAVALQGQTVFLPARGDDSACEDCGAVLVFGRME